MSQPASATPPTPRKRWAWLGLLIVAGMLFGLAAMLGITVIARRGRLPTLTPAAFTEARQRWETHGPENYNVLATVSGRQPASYQVEVRGGKIRTALRNGQPLRQRRTMGTWSVPGMFGTIAADLDSQRRIADGTASPTTPHVRLRAAFDAQLGYPIRYHRMELRGQGGNYEIAWDVEFTALTGVATDPVPDQATPPEPR